MKNIIICSYDEVLIPEMKTSGAAAWDMRAAEAFSITSGEIKLVGAGFKTFIPHGWHANFYARSGLPIKSGLMQANSVAIIDADYRGEYFMQFYNCSKETLSFEQHSRLCQLQFVPIYQPEIPRYGTEEVPGLEIIIDQDTYDNFADLYPSDRGEGRFNSTGL